MKLIQTKEMIGEVISTVIMTFPIWIISGLFLGCVFGFGVAPNGSGILFLFGMLLPVGLIAGGVIYLLRKANRYRHEMVKATKLGDTDYYYCTEVNSIAISTQSRAISILKSKRMLKTPSDVRLNFSIDKVLRYRAHAPGYSTVETQGSVLSGGVNAAFDGMRNTLSKATASKDTGLYLELDDVMNPEIFVRMDFEDAKKWFLLFDKLGKGSLDKQPFAMFYPCESRWAPF